MPHPIEMNMSLFVHILLDSEGQGLWKVLGNNFVNTAGYLKQYIDQLPKGADRSPQIPGLTREKLNFLMNALGNLEENYNDYIRIFPKYEFQSPDLNQISDLINEKTTEILSLSQETNYMLPGGWINHDGGHAMIYQFNKIPETANSPEKIRFSIYNAGSGIDKHQKQSEITHEAYFPVAIYEIPTENLNQTELNSFIRRLIIPFFVNYKDPKTDQRREPYGSEKLYDDIESSMPFLNDTTDLKKKAQMVSTSTIFPENFNIMTTAGQISGTCAQRSIHQMLKVNFNNLPDYQRFIVNFEIYALSDFINQLQQNSQQDSQEIIETIKTINLAIDNLLKILQEPNVFSKKEQSEFHKYLNQCRQTISNLINNNNNKQAKLRHYFNNYPSAQNNWNGSNEGNRNKSHKNKQVTIYKCIQLPVDNFSTKDIKFLSCLNIPASLPSFNNQNTIFNDIQILLERCETTAQNNPPDYLWIIDTIDQIINRLPLPNDEQGFQEGIEPYKNLSGSECKQIEETLFKLQKLYVETMTNKVGSGVYPSLHLTHCSFLALQDYFSTQYAKKTFTAIHVLSNRLNPHHYLKILLKGYFNTIYHSPYVATNNPVFDERLSHLKTIYSSSDQYVSLIKLYDELLNTEKECAQILNSLYKNNEKYHAHNDGTPTCLHSLLVEHKKEALYCLFEFLDIDGNLVNDSPLKQDEYASIFEPLLANIQLAIRMEKTIVQTFSTLAKLETPCKLKIEKFDNNAIRLASHSNGNQSSSKASTYWDIIEQRDKFEQLDSIYSHKYKALKVNSPSIQSILKFHDYHKIYLSTKRSYSANYIQLNSNGQNSITSPLNKENFFTSRLKHLRLSPLNQIRLTLNFFLHPHHMNRLSDFDNQYYVEANLFEPGLLNAILQEENFNQDSSFLKRFDTFIQNGFHKFNQEATNNLTIQSLFFVRLTCYLNCYMLEHAQAFYNNTLLQIASERLKDHLNLINEQISVYANINFNSFNQNNLSILTSLHEYRFLIMMSLLSLNELSEEDQKQLLESYFYLQSHENTVNPNDKASIFERQRVERAFQSYLQITNKTALEINAKKVLLNSLQIPPENLDDFEIKGTYPDYKLYSTTTELPMETEYDINVEQGRIFKNACCLINIPLKYTNHPLLKRFGIEKATGCFISSDGNTMEFYPIGIRIKKYSHIDEIEIIQKQWCVNSKIEWYDLQPVNPHQRLNFFLNPSKEMIENNDPKIARFNSSSSQIKWPATLEDGDSEYWVNVDNSTKSFIAKKGQILYHIIRDNNDTISAQRWSTIEGSNTRDLSNLLPDSQYHDTFSYFEDRNYLEINLNKNSTGIAYLPRYGLSFELNYQYITLSQTHYCLDTSKPINSPFKPEIKQLTLIHQKQTNKPDAPEKQLCIVPVQRFYFIEGEQKSGQRSRFTHDTNNHIAEYQLKEQNTSIPNCAQWHHTNTTESIQFPIIDGKIKPKSAADALYLCYLYLGSSEPDKAWAVLENIRTSLPLEGSYQEITYLFWIINALPVILKDDPYSKTTHKHASLGSPRDVACQLKALALYTDLLAQGKKPRFPDENQFDLTTMNGHYETFSLTNVKSFYETLPETVYKKYSQLLNMRDHLSESYELQDSECKSLLTYCRPMFSKPDQQNSKQLHLRGTLGYEYRRLSLKALITEQARLEALFTAQQLVGHSLSPDLEKRYQNIQQEITEQSEVMKCETRLEMCSIDLTLSSNGLNNIPYGCGLLYDCIWGNNNILPTLEEQAEAVNPEHFVSDIQEKEFFKNLKSYFFIAASGNDNQHYKVLHQFCVNYLAAQALKSQKQMHPMHYVVNMLYRVMHKPQYLKNDNGGWKMNLTLATIQDTITKDQDIGNITLTPIEIRQAKDVFETPLKQTQEIIEELLITMPTVQIPRTEMNRTAATMFKEVSFDRDISSLQDILKNSLQRNSDFAEFCETYIKIENTYQQQLKALENAQYTDAKKEQLAGEYQYEYIEQQRALAEKALQSLNTRNQLRDAAAEEQTRINKLLDLPKGGLWNKVVQFANNRLISEFQIQLDAKQRRELTKEDLLALYFNDDLALMMEKTQLSIEDCQTLRQHIHRCLLLEIQRQQATRLIKGLGDLHKQNREQNTEPNAIQLANIANIFMSQNLPEVANDPVMTFFQYKEDLLLRPRQYEALKDLFETPPEDIHAFKQSVEKIIMGGGKSKVLLPLLAQKKATGFNLVIIEVPPALLATNHTDLNNISQRLFNQKTLRFDFNRESDCSAERLEAIYQQFNDLRLDRGYLVTTGESMKSLALKAIELLLSPEPSDKEKREQHEAQIYWAEKIVELLKKHGDVIIDEAHLGLLHKRKLNFTFGVPEAVDPVTIRHTLDLYQFMYAYSQPNHKNAIDPASLKEQWLEISQNRQQFIEILLKHKSSPLNKFIPKLITATGHSEQQILNELTGYLMEEHMPEFLMTADPTIQDAFAFYKEQLRLLPQTLDRHYKEHYGPSKNERKTVLERTLAIPYSANDKPNERSQFGNALETLNYSTQSLLIEGLNLPLLIQLIEHWQALDKTLTSKKNKKVIPTINYPDFPSLRDIDTKDIAKMEILLKHVHHRPDFLFALLESKILPQITVESSILHSDSMNHVSLYHSAQAISGTPENYMTFLQTLKYNQKAALGITGYIQQLLRHKKTPVHGIDFTDLSTYLEALYSASNKRDKTHAIMDICAIFRGKTNLEVVKAIADSSFCKPNSHAKPIKQILYYKTLRNAQGEESDVLYAYNIIHKTSIKLDSTDPDDINEKLDSTPEERFTYYDQVHTTGVDLKQGLDSNGLCLVDEKSELFQGAYRMRGIGEQQTIEIFVPSKMKDISLDDLLETMKKNAEEQLKKDVISATLAQLNNVIREKALQYIACLDEKDISTKKAWANVFEHYFVASQTQSLWKQYGAIYSELDTNKFFEIHANKLIENWNTTLKKLPEPQKKIVTGSVETNDIKKTMDEIIKISLPFCHPKSLSPHRNNGLEVEIQQEIQTEQEQEKELQQEEQLECYKDNLQESNYIPWTRDNINHIKTQTSLNTICSETLDTKEAYAEPVTFFSENVKVSPNYANVFKGQKHFLGPLTKPIDAILFQQVFNQETRQNSLVACIISNQELEELTHLLKTNPINGLWVGTTQHDVLAGKRPDDINIQTDQEYLGVIEQIQFLEGECATLFEQKTPLYWLSQSSSENTQQKMEFLQKKIMPYRETHLDDFKLLQSKLTQKYEALDYIHQHPANDLTTYDWNEEYPGLSEVDIILCQNTASTYKKINQFWRDRSNNRDDFNNSALPTFNDFELPSDIGTLLNQYINQLKASELEEIRELVSTAVEEYERQELSIFKGFGFHKTEKGLKNAKKLKREIIKDNLTFEQAKGLIDAFLNNYTLLTNKSQYSKKSCAHHLLIKLTSIKNKNFPWEEFKPRLITSASQAISLTNATNNYGPKLKETQKLVAAAVEEYKKQELSIFKGFGFHKTDKGLKNAEKLKQDVENATNFEQAKGIIDAFLNNYTLLTKKSQYSEKSCAHHLLKKLNPAEENSAWKAFEQRL